MTKQELNKREVEIHFKLKSLNYIHFESSRSKQTNLIEQAYIIRNQKTIYEDEYYKQLLSEPNKLES